MGAGPLNPPMNAPSKKSRFGWDETQPNRRTGFWVHFFFPHTPWPSTVSFFFLLLPPPYRPSTFCFSLPLSLFFSSHNFFFFLWDLFIVLSLISFFFRCLFFLFLKFCVALFEVFMIFLFFYFVFLFEVFVISLFFLWFLLSLCFFCGFFPIFFMCATYCWKILDKGYNFVWDLISIKGLYTKVWTSKIVGVLTLGILVFPFGKPKIKWHLGASPMARHKVYYKEEGGSFF
jgi:hypothetical protein